MPDKIVVPAFSKTSLYKVHSLFSLLDLNRAYVTDRGRLVGVVALRDLRIAIQQAANGIQPIKQQHGEFIEEEPNVLDIEKGFINGPPKSPRLDHPHPEFAQHFVAGMELQRSAEEDVVQHNDILTPALKVVHPSSASLHHYNNHPLLTIQEENDATSLKSAPHSYERPSSPPRTSILKKKEPPLQKRDQVAKAVAYLRRKSISLDKTNDDLLPGREKI
uniref:CBS domain-containing protein n=1 Tax=Panagrolaimus superbus TaxID=310955 RepID=A0A914YGK1_9BILA